VFVPSKVTADDGHMDGETDRYGKLTGAALSFVANVQKIKPHHQQKYLCAQTVSTL
jgi:hypothetical protein